MAEFNNMKLTTKGLALQSKAQTGVQLNFTKVQFGDGSLASGEDILNLTALKSAKMTTSISSNKVIDDGTSQIRTVLSNAELTNGFYLREVGIFAQDPDEGEILYAYTNSGEYADFIPAGTGKTIVENTFDLIVIVGNASNVTATVPSGGYVSHQDWDEKNQEIDSQMADIMKLDSVNMILQGTPTTGNGYGNEKINNIIALIQSGVLLSKTLDFKGFTIDLNDQIKVPSSVNIINVSANVFHTDKSAFELQGRHIIYNIGCFYPEQDMTGQNIIEYPAFITSDGNMGYSIFNNIRLGNAYRGLDFSNGISGGCILRDITGYPLFRGIIVDKCIDVTYIDRIHFNPNFFGVPDIRLRSWVWQNGIGVECRRWDFGVLDKVFTWGYFAPFKVTNGSNGGSANNLKFTNWIADACQQFCVFEHFDGGLLFAHGTGTFYNPYKDELITNNLTVPTQVSSIGTIEGGGASEFSSQLVVLVFNRIYRAEEHGIWTKNPIKMIGNEIQNYGHNYTADSGDVIDAVQLLAGSDGSIIYGNNFDGKNIAQNRCVAIIGSSGHKINTNNYVGWKSFSIYNDGTGYNEIDGHGIGTTTQRPMTNNRKGSLYFDTTLNKYILWDGTKWVDFNGAAV